MPNDHIDTGGRMHVLNLWRHVWLGGRRRLAGRDTLTPTHRSDHTTAMGFGTAATATAMGTDTTMDTGTGTDTDADTIHVVPRMAHWLP